MANRRELVLALVSDSSQFNRGIGSAEKSLTSFGKAAEKESKSGGMGQLNGRINAVRGSLGGLAAAAGGLLAVNHIKEFAKDSVRAFSDLSESTNAVEQTFGKSSEKIKEFARTAAQTVGLAESQAQQLVVPIGALLQNFGFGAEEAADKAIELTQRAADLASVFNVDVTEALTAVQAALRGEGDPIEKFGANVSAARVEAFLLAEGLVKTKSEIDDAAKVQGRLGLILQDTARYAGDFASTSDQLANAQRVAAAESENLKAILGEQLAPEYAKLIDLQTLLVKGAAIVAVSLRNAETPAQKAAQAIALFQLKTGAATDSAAALVVAIGELDDGLSEVSFDVLSGDVTSSRSQSILELVRQSELGIDQLNLLGDNLGYLQDEFGLTEHDAEFLTDAIAKVRAEIEATTADTVLLANAAGTLDGEFDEAGVAVDKAREAYNKSRDEAMRFRDVLRGLEAAQRAANSAFLAAADPAFAAASAMERLRDAEESLADTREDSEASATDLANAELAVAEARLELQGSLNALDEASLIRVFDTLAAAMGGSQEEARELLEALGLLDGLEVVTVVETKYTTSGSPPAGSGVGGGGGRIGARATGGPVTGGEPYLVGERGPELFVPESSGNIVPNGGFGSQMSLTQNFYQLPAGDISQDIQKGLLVAGLGRYAEVG